MKSARIIIICFRSFLSLPTYLVTIEERLTGLRHIVVLITNICYEDMVKITVRSERENNIRWRQKESMGIFIFSLVCESSCRAHKHAFTLVKKKKQQHVCNVSTIGNPFYTQGLRTDNISILCLTTIKIPDSQRESRCHYKLHCLHKQSRLNKITSSIRKCYKTCLLRHQPTANLANKPSKESSLWSVALTFLHITQKNLLTL